MVIESIISFIMRGKNRREILKLIDDNQKISAEIEKALNIRKTHVSRTLKELMQHKLIECVNPEDRSYRFYKITNEGKIVLEKIKEIEKNI